MSVTKFCARCLESKENQVKFKDDDQFRVDDQIHAAILLFIFSVFASHLTHTESS